MWRTASWRQLDTASSWPSLSSQNSRFLLFSFLLFGSCHAICCHVSGFCFCIGNCQKQWPVRPADIRYQDTRNHNTLLCIDSTGSRDLSLLSHSNLKKNRREYPKTNKLSTKNYVNILFLYQLNFFVNLMLKN